jgi:HAD superfamily phosphoserine phosphatase-like hydrolase
MRSLTENAQQFIDSVLRLKPRVAAFDCDGTLWEGDSGEGFFYFEMKRGLVSADVTAWAKARYADYRAGLVDEDTMCGEMVTMNSGVAESKIVSLAEEYFERDISSRVFPEMRELVQQLQAKGCEIWLVSSTNEWVIRAAAKNLGTSPDRVIAAAVEIDKGVVTDRLLRVPSGEGKEQGLRALARKKPDAAFGNSRWDVEMLEMARHGFAINPNADLEELAPSRDWTIYFPEAVAEIGA